MSKETPAKLYVTRLPIYGVYREVAAVKMEYRNQALTLYGTLDLGHHSYKYLYVDGQGTPQVMEASAFEALFEEKI